MMRNTRDVSVQIDEGLILAAERFAARDGLSLDQFVILAVSERVGAARAAEFFARRGTVPTPAEAMRRISDQVAAVGRVN